MSFQEISIKIKQSRQNCLLHFIWAQAKGLSMETKRKFHLTMDMPYSKLWLSGKEPACNAGDKGSIPGLGRSPGEGNGNPLQYSCLENLLVREAWWATAHRGCKESDMTEHIVNSLFILSFVSSTSLNTGIFLFQICKQIIRPYWFLILFVALR